MKLEANWDSAVKAARGGRGRSGKTGVTVSTFSNDKNRQCRASLTICEKTMKRFRWHIGDQVLFVRAKLDGHDCIAVRRVPKHGFTLTPAQSKKGEADRLAGKAARATVRRSTGEFADIGSVHIGEHQIIETDGVMALMLPSQDTDT